MSTNFNPFVVSGKIPEAYFCDRKEEAEQLIKAMTNQLNVVLTSPRRMGKTSLVDFVFNKPAIKDAYITISVDILQTTTFREFIYTSSAKLRKNCSMPSMPKDKCKASRRRLSTGSIGCAHQVPHSRQHSNFWSTT